MNYYWLGFLLWHAREEKTRASLWLSSERIHLQRKSLRRHGFYPWVGKIPSRRKWQPTPVLLPGESHGQKSLVGCRPWGRRSQTRLSDFTFTFHFHALEKEMATHSSVLAWRIPGTGEPGGLPSMGSHRVRHDWSDLAAAAAAYTIQTSEKWEKVFLGLLPNQIYLLPY